MKADVVKRKGKTIIRCGMFELDDEYLMSMDGRGDGVKIHVDEFDCEALYTIFRSWRLIQEQDKTFVTK